MSLIKSFTYTGPDQEVRVGSETFSRHVLTTVSDEATIVELRTRDDFTEVNPAPVVEKPKATPAPAPKPAPVPAPVVVEAKPEEPATDAA